MYSWVSSCSTARCSTARGSNTGLNSVGPTKFKTCKSFQFTEGSLKVENMSAWSSYIRYNIGNNCNDWLLVKLHKGAFISVVNFNMEKVLLYWTVDQYNNLRKLYESCWQKEGGSVARMAQKEKYYISIIIKLYVIFDKSQL